MAQLLVRDLDPEVVARLKQRAARHGRSLQGEAKILLTKAAGLSFSEARRKAKAWQTKLAGRNLPDSAELLREDRDR